MLCLFCFWQVWLGALRNPFRISDILWLSNNLSVLLIWVRFYKKNILINVSAHVAFTPVSACSPVLFSDARSARSSPRCDTSPWWSSDHCDVHACSVRDLPDHHSGGHLAVQHQTLPLHCHWELRPSPDAQVFTLADAISRFSGSSAARFIESTS